MPVLHPAEIWQQSGRWDGIGGEMFRLKDRNGRDMCLGMTHEEVIAWLAAREIRSYRDLPQIWYQIQTKERDEARPRSGVLRTREFVMKDSYTLDPDVAALEIVLRRPQGRLLPDLRPLRAHLRGGAVGSRHDGRLRLARVHGPERGRRGRRGPLRRVRLRGQRGAGPRRAERPGRSPTPSARRWRRRTPAPSPRSRPCSRSIPPLTIKSLVFIGPDGPGAGAGAGRPRAPRAQARPRAPGRGAAARHPEEVRQHLGVAPGSVGPVGVRGCPHHRRRVAARGPLRGGRQPRGLPPARGGAGTDFACEFADLQVAWPARGVRSCGKPLRIERVIEIGNIFKLGTKYSVPLGAMYLDERASSSRS